MAYQYAPIDTPQNGQDPMQAVPDVSEAVIAKCHAVVAHVKAVLKRSGAHGIVSLGRKFKTMDFDGNKSLNYEEFSKGMRSMNLDEGALNALFRYFDADCNGSITYEEFLTGLRGELNDKRQAIVDQAYAVLDKTGDGQVDLQDVVGRYDVTQHPDVQAGIKTKIEVLQEFLDTFDCGEKDGVVTLEEFSRYYASVSASIDNDDYFELMIRNAWHISGGEGWAENTTCRRVLVTHPNGRQTVEEITNDFDIGENDVEAMKANLRARGIHAIAIELFGDATQAASAAAASPTMGDDQNQKNTKEAVNIRAKNMQSSIIF